MLTRLSAIILCFFVKVVSAQFLPRDPTEIAPISTLTRPVCTYHWLTDVLTSPEPARNCTLHIANCKIEYSRVRAEPAVNVPQARIIAEGNIISEATSFARQGKHHYR